MTQSTLSKPASKPVPLEEYEQKIREKAYLLWEADGCPESDGVSYWLQAEQDLLSE
jgi:hypothetical protein